MSEIICVDLYLHGQNGCLVGINLNLIWLAVETEAVDRFKRATELGNAICKLLVRSLVLGTDESKLDVRVQVRTQVLEWQFELLNSLGFLHGERNEIG